MIHTHVIGAGLAGLAASLDLADAGRAVFLYEAAPAAGGRCRSYEDRVLGCRVDNGNHLLLSGNAAAMAHLRRIGAADTLTGPGAPVFPFHDLADGSHWTARPNLGRLPFWVLDPRRRVPGTRARDYLALLRLRNPPPDALLADLLPPGRLTRALLAPLAIAALNTPPDAASAALFAAVLNATLGRGGAACIPAFPRQGLSESLITPALHRLALQRARVMPGRRITALRIETGRVVALESADGPISLDRQDEVVLAVPAPVAAELLPGLLTPDRFQAIINIHFAASADLGPAGFLGLLGGTAEWVFAKPGHLSVTISAANHLVETDPESLAGIVWADLRAALPLPAAMPPFRVVKERRATFAATPSQQARRPPAATHLANLALAGDWTATGLPATIEGAIQSGHNAATILLERGWGAT